MDHVFCLRLHKEISEKACCDLVCALTSAADLRQCRSCPQGLHLAASCPFDDRRRAARHAARHAEECLRATLRYVVPRYAQDKAFGMRFLNGVAKTRHGWDGRPETLAGIAVSVGLTVRERPWGILRDRALNDFIL